MNISNGEKIVQGLEHPHSLTVLDGKLAFCESRRKALRFIGGDYPVQFPGYTRGLCYTDDKIYIGTSKHRKKSKSTGKKVSANGQESLGCTISILSKRDLVHEKTIDLNEYAFEIYDLISLQRTDAWPVIRPENYRIQYEQSWYHRVETTLEEIKGVIPKGGTLLLVDENILQIRNNILPEHIQYPFLERNGISWGPPEGDGNAFEELRRMKDEKGARYIVFAWPAFWWFYIYPDFTNHLRTQSECILENENVVVFKLQG